MTQKEVLKWFELYFPEYTGDRIDTWFPNGKNSIRIRQTNKQEFIFTFVDTSNWKFETINSFMKGQTK